MKLKKILVLSTVVLLSFSLSSCILGAIINANYHTEEKEYYSNTDNFEIFTGELVSYAFNSEEEYVVLHVKGFDSDHPDHIESFKLEERNYKVVDIAIRMGKLKQGDDITFVSATRIFGDGYMPPIVAIRIGGYSILELDTGYENFMEDRGYR